MTGEGQASTIGFNIEWGDKLWIKCAQLLMTLRARAKQRGRYRLSTAGFWRILAPV